MKTRNLVAVGFAALLLAAGAVFYRSLVPPESPSGSLAFLSSAKTLPIYDREGKVTDLAGQKGRLLIVHFWATWCPPCVEEIPALSEFWDRYKNRRDLALYAISVDKDWKTIDDFSRKSPKWWRHSWRAVRFPRPQPLPGSAFGPCGAALNGRRHFATPSTSLRSAIASWQT